MAATGIAAIQENGREVKRTPTGRKSQEGVFTRIHNTLKYHTGLQQETLRVLQENLIFDKKKDREDEQKEREESLGAQGADRPSGGGLSGISLPSLPPGLKKNIIPLLLLGLGGVVMTALQSIIDAAMNIQKTISWKKVFTTTKFFQNKIVKPIQALFSKEGVLGKGLLKLKEFFTKWFGKDSKFGKVLTKIKNILSLGLGGEAKKGATTILNMLKNSKVLTIFSVGLKAIPFINALFGIFEFITGFIEGYKEEGVLAGFREGFSNLISFFVDDVLGFIQTALSFIAKWTGFEGLSEKIAKFKMPNFSEMFESVFNFISNLFGSGKEEDITSARDSLINPIMKMFDALKLGIYSFAAGVINALMGGIEAIPTPLGIGSSLIEGALLSLDSAKKNIANMLGVDPTATGTPGAGGGTGGGTISSTDRPLPDLTPGAPPNAQSVASFVNAPQETNIGGSSMTVITGAPADTGDAELNYGR